MTVQELIRKLRECADQDAIVVLIVEGSEVEDFAVTDYGSDEEPFVALES